MATAAPLPDESAGWLDLLRAFGAVYGHGPTGGSRPIARHCAQVSGLIDALIAASPALLSRPAAVKPVCTHLPRALELGQAGPMQDLARALAGVAPRLHWEWGYAQMPRKLARAYAYCEVAGPRGPVPSERLILGFVLFAPGTLYPAHNHAGIAESYVAVAGDWSENDLAVHLPGALVYNPPGHEHQIATGTTEPSLLAYAWTGPRRRLVTPGMVLSGD